MILQLLLIALQTMAAITPKTVDLNNQAAKDIEGQNYVLAEKKLVEALGHEPMLPELHLNLGLAFLGQGQIEKAQSSFEFAAKQATRAQTKFMALFNLGFMAGKQQKIDEALNYYQQALEVMPDSIETKTNIELLTKDQDQKGKNGQSGDKNQQQKPGEGQQDQDQKNDKDKDDDKNQKDQENKPKEYQKPKPQPKQFKSEELTQADVNKILGEIKQQEQKIRSEFNKKDAKEKPRAKDW
jgi:Ca-activated chloride channel family protein